jgi:small neutral amino acid transporter SnatA (MarC family)
MSSQPALDATAAHHDDHGSTPAAWTTVAIIVLAFVVGTLAIILGNWVMFWVGVGLIVVGVVVGKVMAMMGLGKQR